MRYPSGQHFFRVDWRCPLCGKDFIVIAHEGYARLKCAACKHWFSKSELQALRTEVFAPPLNASYVGAVCESEPRHQYPIDWDLFA